METLLNDDDFVIVDLEQEKENSGTKRTLKISPWYFLVLCCVVIFLGYKGYCRYEEEATAKRAKEEMYQIGVSRLCEGNLTGAVVYLEDCSGYKDATELVHYCRSKQMSIDREPTYYILVELNKIPEDYDGLFCEEIKALHDFVQTDEYKNYVEEKKRVQQMTNSYNARINRALEELERSQQDARQTGGTVAGGTGKNGTTHYNMTSELPDCDDYEDFDDFMDNWDGNMPGGIDAEEYWDNW